MQQFQMYGANPGMPWGYPPFNPQPQFGARFPPYGTQTFYGPEQQIPGVGFLDQRGKVHVYPTHTGAMTAQNPYSPYNYAGYDSTGFPLPHPGVASATPYPGSSG